MVKPKTERMLRKKIDRLKKLEEAAFGPRHGKNDFYGYLEGVLRLYWAWTRAGKGRAKLRRKQLCAIYGISQRKGRSALHVVVEVSSRQKLKTKNRWVQGLRFTHLRRKAARKSGLTKFWLEHGGIAGCATHFAAHKATRKGTPKKPIEWD